MEKSIEVRLTRLARRIFAQYKSQLMPEYARQLDKAIGICEAYQQGEGSWSNMYVVILCDDGIWEYSEGLGDFSKELRTMWVMETCILMCSCWLGCQKEQDIEPEDMDIRGENIPAFLTFLEGLPDSLPNCAQIWEYWNKNLCW